jgi:hypothetical protein
MQWLISPKWRVIKVNGKCRKKCSFWRDNPGEIDFLSVLKIRHMGVQDTYTTVHRRKKGKYKKYSSWRDNTEKVIDFFCIEN